MARKDRFERFCEILAEHPGISANGYDRLPISDHPARRPLELRFKCSWTGLVSLATGRKKVKRKQTGKVEMTRSAFLSRFDDDVRIREAIRAGVKSLVTVTKPDDDIILAENDFRLERCGSVPPTLFGRVAREEEFRKYRFRSKGRVFWTTPRTKKWALEHVSSAREL